MEELKGPDGSLLQRTREVFLTQMEAHGHGRLFNPEEIMVPCRTASAATT